MKLAESAPDWRTRLHALWTLDGLDAHRARDRDEGARRSVARCARCGDPHRGAMARRARTSPVQAAVLKRLDDADWAVAHQLAASLARCRRARASVRSSLLERHGGRSDRRGCGAERVAGQEGGRPRATAGDSRPTQTPQREAALTMLAATIVRSGAGRADAEPVRVDRRRTRRPAWQRAALLRGAEVALLGAPCPARRPDERCAAGDLRVRRVRAGALVRAARTRTRRLRTSCYRGREAAAARGRCG